MSRQISEINTFAVLNSCKLFNFDTFLKANRDKKRRKIQNFVFFFRFWSFTFYLLKTVIL